MKPKLHIGSIKTSLDEPLRETNGEAETLARLWWGASSAVLLVATALRFAALELKPLHHDEGVNAFFLTRLVREGIYHYDPANYHGPTLYYFALPPALALGLNTFAIRLVPALFGIATVWLMLCLRRRIGTVGALTAAALVAVSPGAVYLSRYFIHETLFVFFTVGLVVAALRYYDTAQAIYLTLAAASAALLFATKETAFISAGVLILATGVSWTLARFALDWGWTKKRKEQDAANRRKGREPSITLSAQRSTEVADPLARFGGSSRVMLSLLAAIALFIFINVLFYSSFFTYGKGVAGALETFKIWTKTGTRDHSYARSMYLVWLLKEEAPLLILGIIGAAWAVWRATNRFAVFAGAWAFGLLVAYSLIPYKTPWLALNFIVPLAVIAGDGVNELYQQCGKRVAQCQAVILALALVAIMVGTYQAIQLNFYHYDNDRYPYVYAHTRRELLQLVDEIERLAERAGTGKNTAVSIVSPDYWPLPWYLQDYKRAVFHGRIAVPLEPIVVANESQDLQLQPLLGANYQRIGTSYALRPGVDLVLYARHDLATR